VKTILPDLKAVQAAAPLQGMGVEAERAPPPCDFEALAADEDAFGIKNVMDPGARI